MFPSILSAILSTDYHFEISQECSPRCKHKSMSSTRNARKHDIRRHLAPDFGHVSSKILKPQGIASTLGQG